MMAVAHQVFGLVPTDFAQLAPIVIVPPCEPFHCPHQQASLGSTELDYTDVRRPVVRGQEFSLNLRVTFGIISWFPFHICKFWHGFFSWATMNNSNVSSKFVDEFQSFVIVVVTHGSRVSSATPVGSSHATSCLIFECWRINAKLKLLKFVIRFSQFWLDAFFFKTKCN